MKTSTILFLSAFGLFLLSFASGYVATQNLFGMEPCFVSIVTLFCGMIAGIFGVVARNEGI